MTDCCTGIRKMIPDWKEREWELVAAFLKRVLPLMGAEPGGDYKEEGQKFAKLLQWHWYINRSGAAPCDVVLRLYEQPQDATDLDEAFYPQAACAAAPDLARVAVVSAPAETKGGESVATLFNRRVAEALTAAKAKAENKGWYPNASDYLKADGSDVDDDAFEAAVRAYRAD